MAAFVDRDVVPVGIAVVDVFAIIFDDERIAFFGPVVFELAARMHNGILELDGRIFIGLAFGREAAVDEVALDVGSAGVARVDVAVVLKRAVRTDVEVVILVVAVADDEITVVRRAAVDVDLSPIRLTVVGPLAALGHVDPVALILAGRGVVIVAAVGDRHVVVETRALVDEITLNERVVLRILTAGNECAVVRHGAAAFNDEVRRIVLAVAANREVAVVVAVARDVHGTPVRMTVVDVFAALIHDETVAELSAVVFEMTAVADRHIVELRPSVVVGLAFRREFPRREAAVDLGVTRIRGIKLAVLINAALGPHVEVVGFSLVVTDFEAAIVFELPVDVDLTPGGLAVIRPLAALSHVDAVARILAGRGVVIVAAVGDRHVVIEPRALVDEIAVDKGIDMRILAARDERALVRERAVTLDVKVTV